MAAMIYFLQSSSSGLVKIGMSIVPAVRYKSVCSEWSEHLLTIGAICGEKQIEKQFHEMFRGRRIVGEWFLPNDAMRDLVEDMVPLYVPTSYRRFNSQPVFVTEWPWFSYRVRQVTNNLPARYNESVWRRSPRDPSPLPLPCCPMLKTADACL